MNFENFEFPKPIISYPSSISLPDTKTLRIANAIDNIQNVNRLRDMDNLFYQIKMKEQQMKLYKKRLNSINSTIDIKAGMILSLLIIIFSVILPFYMVSCEHIYIKFKTFVFIYMLTSFVLSMGSMAIYLFCLWNKK